MEETIQYLERGKEFLNNGQLDEALNEFKKAVEIEPNLADAHYSLGLVYFNQGNLDAATAEYKKAIRINPDEAMEKIVKSEDNLANFCMSEPDAGLELIETIISEEPEFESNLFLKFTKAMAYKSKVFQTLQNRIPISHIENLDLEEFVKEIRLHINDEELNYLELALSESRVHLDLLEIRRQIEDVDPEFVGKIGTEEDRRGENEVEVIATVLGVLEMIATILERCRPGRVQQILGKTKLSYFGVDRVKVPPNIEQLPPGELKPFTDVFFSLDSIVKSAILVLLDRDARGRKYIMCLLYKRPFDELGPDETFEDAQLGGTIYLFDDGTFADTVEKESEPGDEIMKSAEEKKESKFCFIATSVYGTPYTPEVQTLKKFRDEFLLPKGLGRLFVSFYYRVSPVFASAIAKSKLAQRFTKLVILKPILWFIRGYKYMPDERNKER